jgi:hypothetical protein
MVFDLRKTKRKPESNLLSGKNKWDLKTYKVRRNVFPNAKALGEKGIDKEIIKIFGEEFVKAIVEEAKKASSKGASIPKSENFYNSFSYEITKGGKIKIHSTWKWVNKYLEAKSPYEMNIYRRRGESKVIPLRTKDGGVVFRQAPLVGSKGWIHPAILKYNFIEVGLKKGEDRAIRRALTYIQTSRS